MENGIQKKFTKAAGSKFGEFGVEKQGELFEGKAEFPCKNNQKKV